MMNNRRKLGKADLMVSPIMFGGNVFGWTLDETSSHKMLDSFVGAGFNFIDTADTYSKWVPGNQGGESETIIGNWLKKTGKRSDVIIATKLGGDLGNNRKGLKPKYIKTAVEDSLMRLQTDHIDLYQSHYDDPETPVEETMQAFNELIQEGKVRYIGASNVSADRIKASNQFATSNGLSPYVSLQPLYNLMERQKFEKEYQALVTDQSMAVLPYYALASGFLSGKYRSEEDLDKSPRGQGVKKYLTPHGKNVLAVLDEVAGSHNVSPAQIAIAWLLHKPAVTAAIASATNEKQLNELMKAATLALSPHQMQRLDEASAYE